MDELTFEWDPAKADSNLTKDRGQMLVVVFTERGERIRIISARVATRREQREYEEHT